MVERQLVGIVVATALLQPGVTPKSSKVQTLKGRLVDEVCYGIDKTNTGDSHPGMARDCATTCAQKGSPVALLTADGNIYEISGGLAADHNAKLVPHIAHLVQIRGVVDVYPDGMRYITAGTLVRLTK